MIIIKCVYPLQHRNLLNFTLRWTKAHECILMIKRVMGYYYISYRAHPLPTAFFFSLFFFLNRGGRESGVRESGCGVRAESGRVGGGEVGVRVGGVGTSLSVTQ